MKDKTIAEITDIQTNDKTGVSIVGVKINVNNREITKAFQINHSSETISFDDFKVKLVELVKSDIEAEKKKNDIIDEITKHKGVPFELDIKGDIEMDEGGE